MENTVTLKMSELTSKFKTHADKVNFCREMGFFFPSLPGFDSKYFLDFIQGRKKLLPLGMMSGFSFSYYTKTRQFTKQHLVTFFQNDLELQSYIPTDIKISSLNREYLLSVLAYVRKDTWMDLYNQYKEKLSMANYTKWENYGIDIEPDMKERIKNFVGSAGGNNNKPFRTSKKGVPNNSIKPL